MDIDYPVYQTLTPPRRVAKVSNNNTPHASRQISAPWGVTFLRRL